ncbi:MAG: hypothetical protein IPQ25_10925 [Chitinophagaceae bacterium]|nr:hypothetical protein [Chitinophagaceae bacterium]
MSPAKLILSAIWFKDQPLQSLPAGTWYYYGWFGTGHMQIAFQDAITSIKKFRRSPAILRTEVVLMPLPGMTRHAGVCRPN